MKLFYGFLTLALALVISGVAAYFSVVGLAAIFSATAGAVIVMGCALEAGKLASAGWLHQNWENSKVSKLHKSYMVAAVCALMVITALGIYGFLAHGHLAQQAPLASVELQIAQKQAQIDQINGDLSRLNTQENQLDATVNAVVGQDASKGLRARGRLSSERKEIQKNIDSDNAQLNTITAQLVPLKLQISEVETKLGPIKYVADLFGIKDTESAVRIVILILMFAFDPLAVVLVLSSAISISDGLEENRTRKLNTSASKSNMVLDDVIPNDSGGQVLPQSQPDIPMPTVSEKIEDNEPSNLLVELEAHPDNVKLEMSDKEKLLDILERKPELLQSVVEAVREEHATTSGPLKASWLD